MLDGNCAVGCGPGTDYPYIHIFQCILERTDAVTNEDLEPITFVLSYPPYFVFITADAHGGPQDVFLSLVQFRHI